jgi:hypothetical protein
VLVEIINSLSILQPSSLQSPQVLLSLLAMSFADSSERNELPFRHFRGTHSNASGGGSRVGGGGKERVGIEEGRSLLPGSV